MTGPLEGYRILDLTQVVMGPVATQVLADYGAEVIKIEPPTGDTSRHIPPMKNPNMGYIFLHANRGKKSVVLDLKTPEALDALMALARTADVLVCNVRPKAMERLGITYERLAEVNPRLIYVNLVGFGLDGPYADDPAYEDMIQSLTGVPTLLTQAGADAPMFVPLAFNDRACGLSCANAVLAALLGRHKSGRGQHIVLPMFETMAQAVLSDHMGGRSFVPPIGPMGYQRILNDLRRPYETSDGYVSMVLYADKHWRAFLRIVGKDEWFDEDPRLQSLTQRAHHAREIYKPIAELMKTKSSAEWLRLLKAADIPAVAVNTLDSLMDDPQLAATGALAVTEHPTEGTMVSLAAPTRWSDGLPVPVGHAPNLGEHSEEVLLAAGLSPEQVARLL